MSENLGAEIVFFSPLEDEKLPAGTSGVILSSGFPEIYAEKLSTNNGMRQALREAHAQEIPIYAECGGLMALTHSITDLDGNEHPMFGLLPGKSIMTKKLNMGYRTAKVATNSWLFRRGEEVRGHEFHYSIWENDQNNLQPTYTLTSAGQSQLEGASLGSLWASYLHLPFWNKPELALRFVQHSRKQISSEG